MTPAPHWRRRPCVARQGGGQPPTPLSALLTSCFRTIKNIQLKSCFSNSCTFQNPSPCRKTEVYCVVCKQRHSVGHTWVRGRGRVVPQSSFRGRCRWRSVDIVDSNLSSYWTLGVDAVPEQKHGWQTWWRAVCCVHPCVCVCERAKERERQRDHWKHSSERERTQGIVIIAVSRGDAATIYHCLHFAQRPSEV